MHRDLPGVLLAMVLLASGGTAPAAGYYGSGWYREADAELRYDDNLGRSGNALDRVEDFSARLRAGAGYDALSGPERRFGLGARFGIERFGEFHALDNLEGTLEGYYIVQPHPGQDRPWYEAWARLTRLEHRDSDARDGTVIEAGLQAGRRFGDRASGRLGYVHTRRRGDGPVFDLDSHAAEFDFDLLLHPRATLYGGYGFHWGELASSARASPGLRDEAEAVVLDDAFGRGSGPDCLLRRCAWRLDGRTHVLNGGVQWRVAGDMYLDLSLRWFRVRWGDDARYKGLNLGGAFYLRF